MYISMYKKLHNGRLTLINVALAYTTGKKTDAQVGLKNGRQLVDDWLAATGNRHPCVAICQQLRRNAADLGLALAVALSPGATWENI